MVLETHIKNSIHSSDSLFTAAVLLLLLFLLLERQIDQEANIYTEKKNLWTHRWTQRWTEIQIATEAGRHCENKTQRRTDSKQAHREGQTENRHTDDRQ